MLVLGNVGNYSAMGVTTTAQPSHGTNCAGAWHCYDPRQGTDALPGGGISVDQVIAAQIGAQTKLPFRCRSACRRWTRSATARRARTRAASRGRARTRPWASSSTRRRCSTGSCRRALRPWAPGRRPRPRMRSSRRRGPSARACSTPCSAPRRRCARSSARVTRRASTSSPPRCVTSRRSSARRGCRSRVPTRPAAASVRPARRRHTPT